MLFPQLRLWQLLTLLASLGADTSWVHIVTLLSGRTLTGSLPSTQLTRNVWELNILRPLYLC